MRLGMMLLLAISLLITACAKPKMPPPPMAIYRAENCIASDQVSQTWLRISQSHQQACQDALNACHHHNKHHTKCIVLS